MHIHCFYMQKAKKKKIKITYSHHQLFSFKYVFCIYTYLILFLQNRDHILNGFFLCFFHLYNSISHDIKLYNVTLVDD